MLFPLNCVFIVLFRTLNAPIETFPEKVGLAVFAFELNAVVTAVDIGLFKSEVLSTLFNPTIAFVIPLTAPVNLAPASEAFAFSAVDTTVDIGLL